MRKTRIGDLIKIDFVGTIDGIEFDGGTATNYYLELGSNTFIKGFEKKLINYTVGDIVDVKVQFPNNYGDQKLAGKWANFKTTIKYILDTDY